jgi:hypothetical protein
MFYDVKYLSLIMTIDSTSEGNLIISIPRDILDAKYGYCSLNSDDPDGRFFVLVDGEEVLYDEIMTTYTERTLQIQFIEDIVKIKILVSCLI